MWLTKEQQLLWDIATAHKFDECLPAEEELQYILKVNPILWHAIINYQLHKTMLDTMINNLYEELHHLSVKDYM